MTSPDGYPESGLQSFSSYKAVVPAPTAPRAQSQQPTAEDWLRSLNFCSRGTAVRFRAGIRICCALAAVDYADEAVGRPDERDGWQSFELLGEPTKRRPVNA